MINEQIRDKEVRVISESGEQLGIMSAKDAMKLAIEADLDLVKIAPQAKPPVCKIIDYGKFKYEQIRKEKDAKKKQKTVELKEVRLSPNIDTNDLNTKISSAKKFIAKGNKVKVTLRFRGREMAHMNTSKHILDDFAESLSFDGWKQIKWINPNYVANVQNRALHIVPLYPQTEPFIKFNGFRIYRQGDEIGGDFVVYLKDIVVKYDEAVLKKSAPIDHEAAWGILSARTQAAKKREFEKIGKDEILRYIEKQKMDQTPMDSTY